MDDLAYHPPGTETFVGCLFSGLRVRWYERGPTAKGRSKASAPTILCLHGFPDLSVSFREQLEGLSERYRVVAPDLRGYGGTDAPKRVRDYDLDLLVRDVVELIDALGEERVHLVGHDWGAVIAWEVAQRHGGRLRSLTTINCPPYQILFKEMYRPKQLLNSWYMFLFQLPVVPELYVSRDPDQLIRKQMRETAVHEQVFTAERLEPRIRQIRERGLPGLNYYRALARRLPRRLRPIHVPTKLIWGTQDHALGQWFADEAHYRGWVDDFEVVRIDDGAHWVHEERAEKVNACIRAQVEAVEAARSQREAG
ncbi:Alpha/beta hydrolase fold protein [Plesiocystis pacifica SIR-1]|uniref:Alpha/beta hydrolase fold protein n=1 Tax=Plesiocystis pacifica SIR-1 TaxID=391625 RepID=A6G385_9BACT|nr:alpha/beta fold hydrolase [Plesiocystis pacifica]EDM79710.1 Alpha/beta hydrolase fold protein [Plesiocystis pacifica SIR-1]